MRVLIVEDEPVIAFEMEAIVLDRLPDAEIVVAHSVSEAMAALDDSFAMAFLDIDVTDGKTYPLALELKTRSIPFAFVSGASVKETPEELCGADFVPKPFSQLEILKVIDALARAKDRSD